MHIDLTILPVSHSTPWLHGMVCKGLMHNSLIQNYLSFRKTLLNIANCPFVRWFTHRHHSWTSTIKILLCPFDRLYFTTNSRISFKSSVWTIWMQAIQWIQYERKRFIVNFYGLNSLCCSCFVYSSNCQYRLTLIEGLHRQTRFAWSINFWDIVSR